jgi:cardiolipin synthase
MSEDLKDRRDSSEFRADLLLVPNLVSLGRIVGVLAAATCFSFGYLGWALGLGLLMGVTDYLDGYLARKLNQTSQLGALLDILADLLAALVALTLAVYVRLWPPYLLVAWGVRDMTVMAMRLSAAQQGFTIRASIMGKIATNFTGYAYLLLALDLVRPFEGSPGLTFGIHRAGLVLIHIGIALQWVAGIAYLRLYAGRYRRNPGGGAVS